MVLAEPQRERERLFLTCLDLITELITVTL